MNLTEEEIKIVDELLEVASRANAYGQLPNEYWAGNHPLRDIIQKCCSLNLMMVAPTHSYQLTDFGKEIYRGGGYGNHLKNKRANETREIEIYNNSKEVLIIAKKSLIWGSRNTKWLIVFGVISTLGLIIQLLQIFAPDAMKSLVCFLFNR